MENKTFDSAISVFELHIMFLMCGSQYSQIRGVCFQSMRNESILSFYSKTIPNQNGADFCEDKALLHCSSADNSNDDSMSPLFVEDDADKEEAKKSTSHEHSLINMISETFLTEEGMWFMFFR